MPIIHLWDYCPPEKCRWIQITEIIIAYHQQETSTIDIFDNAEINNYSFTRLFCSLGNLSIKIPI